MTNDERLSKYVQMYNNATYTKNTTLIGVCRRILLNQSKYEDIVKGTQIDWRVIAAIHYRESSLMFDCHIANGDPLTAKTTHVPWGIMPNIDPPYTWQQSARYTFFDLKKWDKLHWDLANTLDNIERYNGLGYRKDGLPYSPYLWSGTQYYNKGKYIQDGKYDPNTVDKQLGCVPILKYLAY